MKIGNIVKNQQSEVYKKLKNRRSGKRRRGKASLFFSRSENMRIRDSWRRCKGQSYKENKIKFARLACKYQNYCIACIDCGKTCKYKQARVE